MTDCKLGKAMASDSEVESRPKDASNPPATRPSSPDRSRTLLAHARSSRNRIIAPHDLSVSIRPRRGWSDRLTKFQVVAMVAAATFAYGIGYPLNLCIGINWSRTWAGDDPDGRILGRLMELKRKWLKTRYCKVFAQIAVRENPDGCPNTHILAHRPPAVLRGFKAQVRNVLSEACRGLNEGAVMFRRVGRGNPTFRATKGKLAYMHKDTDPEEAKEFGISCEPQGWIYGKRASISQDIHRAARQRYAKGAEG